MDNKQKTVSLWYQKIIALIGIRLMFNALGVNLIIFNLALFYAMLNPSMGEAWA